MNRLLLLLCFSLPSLCSGQNYGLCMQVISATGGSGAQGNYDVSWTVGEIAITTLSGVSHIATQGFHQPDVCTPVSTSNLDLAALGIEVFPNPATSSLTIRYAGELPSSLSTQVFDVLGNQVLTPMLLTVPEGTRIDTETWPAGIYFMQIQDNLSKATATVRVVRMDGY